MAGACPAPTAADPLVQGLLATTDCNVQLVVRSGYGALFEGGAGFAGVLTILLTLYVAVFGYRLMLGRASLNVSDLALTAVKIGVVIALATQWGTYQTLVYRFLFEGPQQAADGLLAGLGVGGAGYRDDVFAGLQHAFDNLTAFSPAAPPGTPSSPALPATAQALPGAGAALSKPGFDSLLLMGSAVILLLSSLGVLLAAKIVLGLLLALGPVFIAMLLFESTRGLFEGWLRASVAFAFAPLAVTLMLGLSLTLLAPSLAQIEAMRDTGTYTPGVGFQVLILVLVFAGVSGGLLVVGGMIAGGLRRPRSTPARSASPTVAPLAAHEVAPPSRAARIAAAAVAQERRDALWTPSAVAFDGGDRRLALAPPTRARTEGVAMEARLGQAAPRRAQPRTVRGRSRAEHRSGA